MKKAILINTWEPGFGANIIHDSRIGEKKIPMGPHYPIGIVSVATYLKNKIPEIEIHVFDEQLWTTDKIEAAIKIIKPAVVGIGCMFKSYPKVLKFARTAKKLGSNVVIGGQYGASLRREIMKNRGPKSDDYCIDKVFGGDGEEQFLDYISGKATVRKNRLDLDKLPQLNFEFLNPKYYFEKYHSRFPESLYKKPFLVYSHKGCFWRDKLWGGCIYCSLMYKKFRKKNPKTIWREIDRLVHDYGVDYVWDVSDSFLGHKDWFSGFYNEARKRKNKPRFKIQARADELIDPNTVKMIADMGATQIFVGFESGDDQMLVSMRKGLLSPVNKKAISLLTDNGLDIRGYFILGAPGETKKSLKKTTALAESVINASGKNIISPSVFTPLPGSFAFEMLKKKTGQKYTNKDVLDWDEAINDWISIFCRVSNKDINSALNYLRSFSYDVSSYSF